MSNIPKVTSGYFHCDTFVNLWQSDPVQVLRDCESDDRQYRRAPKLVNSVWNSKQITVIDEVLGLSAEGVIEPSGFDNMTTTAVALKRVCIA